MSNSSASFSFPARTPLFTTVVVLVCFAALGWLAMKYYVPQAYKVDKVEGVRTPADRAALLAEHRAKAGWSRRRATCAYRLSAPLNSPCASTRSRNLCR